MNSYEEKQRTRRERLEERAANLRAAAQRQHDEARQMQSAIPLGQPIHVGHHSEKSDRRYRERIDNKYGKAFCLMEKAEYYEEKAASVGKGGISSDDPDALKKLREKFEAMRTKQEFMRAANAAIRKGKTPEGQLAALMALGIDEKEAREILKPDCFGIIGFAPFTMRNNNANLRRVEKRIRELEQAATAETRNRVGNGYTYREDASENRVMFFFSDKPDEGTRNILKKNGFRWSPRRGAWVRMLNGNGLYAAKEVMKVFDA